MSNSRTATSRQAVSEKPIRYTKQKVSWETTVAVLTAIWAFNHLGGIKVWALIKAMLPLKAWRFHPIVLAAAFKEGSGPWKKK